MARRKVHEVVHRRAPWVAVRVAHRDAYVFTHGVEPRVPCRDRPRAVHGQGPILTNWQRPVLAHGQGAILPHGQGAVLPHRITHFSLGTSFAVGKFVASEVG